MNRFEKLLLTVFFIELFVGGGGRLIDFGVLSIRQVLFLLVLVVFAVRIVSTGQFRNKNVNTFLNFHATSIGIYMLIAWFGVSMVIGVVNGHALSIVVKDFLRVSFFLLYFPLAYYISNERYHKDRIINILKYSSIAVALFTIIVSVLGKFVFVNNYNSFYDFMNYIMNDDLYFRPSRSVFYKSHFFVLMGLLLSLYAFFGKRYTKVDVMNLIFGFVSIIWSETRGFLLAIVLGVLFMVVMDMKIFTERIQGLKQKIANVMKSQVMMRKIVLSLMVICTLPIMYKYMTIGRFAVETKQEQKQPGKEHKEKKKEPEINDVSVNARKEFIKASQPLVFHSIPTFTLGNGYGTSIGGRINGIEMSFLDILVEQGMFGLATWLYVCFLIYYNYHIAYKRKGVMDGNSIALLACITALLLLTNINPFINNALGIGFLLIVLVLSKNKKDSLTSEV